MLMDRLSPYTDEQSMRSVGLTRNEMALTTLKAYLAFSIMAYFPAQHLLQKNDEKRLFEGMLLRLMTDKTKSFFQKQFDKIMMWQADKFRQAGLLVGELLSMGVLDSSFF